MNSITKEIVLFLFAQNIWETNVLFAQLDTILKLDKLVLKTTSIASITMKMEIVTNALKNTLSQA